MTNKGENHPRHKITQEMADSVRVLDAAVRAGKVKMKYGWKARLARRMGVSRSVISDILSGRRWAP